MGRVPSTVIEFTRATYDAVVAHAREGDPAEVCGVLVGHRGTDGDPSVVTRTYETENVAERPKTRYRIDPEAQLEAIEAAEGNGLDVVGFYHSHPAGPPSPSDIDIGRATWPGYSYVICALDGFPFVGSWRWTGEDRRFEQETVGVRDEE